MQVEFDASFDVSIHAPWEGCDGSRRQWLFACHKFQFTTTGDLANGIRFNSRTPGGVRQDRGVVVFEVYVSIHAPREGCDCYC